MQLKRAERMRLARPSFIRESLKLAADPSIICFAGGNPDPDYFPWQEIEKAADIAIFSDWRSALQYGVTEGNSELRRELQKLMESIGVTSPPEQLIITSGSQQGLDIMAKIFLDRGDQVIVESPTYMGAVNAFQYYEPEFIEVEMDENGMRMDALEKALKENPRVKFIYTIPDFQNPTGIVLAQERRKKMAELAEAYDVMIIEDNPYYFLRYEGRAIPPIKHYDSFGRVIYLGSVSKILCPSLRVGWIIANQDVIESAVYLKQAADLHTSELSQRIAAKYLINFDLITHVRQMNVLYQKKKNLMLKEIRETFPEGVRYIVPQGGLFLWLTFPENIDALKLFEHMEHMKEEHHVIFVPGDTFYPYGGHPNTARLSFATVTEGEIQAGIRRLGSALRKLIT